MQREAYVPPHKRGESQKTLLAPTTRKLLEATPQPKFRKELTEAEKALRKAKQQCFNCDEKWQRGHRCNGKLFFLSSDGGYLSEYVENTYEEEDDFKDALEEVPPIDQTLISFCISGMHFFEDYSSNRTDGWQEYVYLCGFRVHPQFCARR